MFVWYNYLTSNKTVSDLFLVKQHFTKFKPSCGCVKQSKWQDVSLVCE